MVSSLFAVATFVVAMAAGEAIIGRASVEDSNTIQVNGQRIQLWGIEAPLGGQTCRDSLGESYRCGERAVFALTRLIAQQPVRCEPRDHDRYGHPIATCYVGDKDLAGLLVAEGWALDTSGGTYAVQQIEARRKRRGLWQTSTAQPWDWRRPE